MDTASRDSGMSPASETLAFATACSERNRRAGSRLASAGAAEGDAGTAANDWEIILGFKALFQGNPAALPALFDDWGRDLPPGCAATVMTAAREALAGDPESVELHYRVAEAEVRLGNGLGARALLERALELDPCHGGALVLLASVCMDLNDPCRALACMQRAQALGSRFAGFADSGGGPP